MSGQKRAFPYASDVPEIALKRRDFGSSRPGQEAAMPRIYESALPGHFEQPAGGTAFSGWDAAEIKVFLDQRGEDFDDCHTLEALVKRAHECELATGPPRRVSNKQQEEEKTDEEEDDPLEAFMASINRTAQADAISKTLTKKANIELDEDADHVVDFLEARRPKAPAQPAAGFQTEGENSDDEVYAAAAAADEEAGIEYDMDDNVVVQGGKKIIDPLPPIHHDEILYDDFSKVFYKEPDALKALSPAEVHTMRRQLGIRTSGFGAPNPVRSFAECGFDSALQVAILRAGFKEPTAIQAQAIPAALSGRDILGIAKTGSGKTAAFVLPLLVHIMDQPELEKGSGPIGVVAAPTRELAEQIHKEARKLGKPYNLRFCAAFGGLSKYEQFKDLKAGAEVAVCTPGRLIDLLKMKACSMQRATYLVLDEADRMFDMGFEAQVRSIVGQIRPDRQTLMFSATMPGRMEGLARDALTSPLRISVGEVGAANEDIKQVAEVVADETSKHAWLLSRLPSLIDHGDVLIFAAQKARVDELTARLKTANYRAAAMHGDLDQHARMAVLHAFRTGQVHVMVATDVASRGLDIKSVRSVVNYDPPKDTDSYVHRVGRTGRAGNQDGTAYSLLTPRDSRFAGELVQTLAISNQEVPQAVHDLAMKHGRFRKSQPGNKGKGAGRGRKAQVGGAGLGFGSPAPSPGQTGLSGFAMAASTEPAQAGGIQGFARCNMESNSDLASRAVPIAATMVEQPPLPPGPPPSEPDSLPPLPPQPAPATQSAARNEMQQMRRGKFQSGFVSSGTQGGDNNARATIVAPKQQAARSHMPAPLPVSALPFVTAANSSSAPRSLPAASASAGQALSVAQAIAARLSGAEFSNVQPAIPVQPSMAASGLGNSVGGQQSSDRGNIEPDQTSYNQQPYQYPSQPDSSSSAGSLSVKSAAAQASIAQAQQAASALFAKFQQQNFPSPAGSQPALPSVRPSRPKWDAQ